jgi:aminoglycoside phosphotransferase (APT) family kinase protein
VARERVVVRLGNPEAARLGIDRVREARIWGAATRAGLGPSLLAFDPATGDAVSRYVELPSAADPAASAPAGTRLSPSALARIAAALRRVHAMVVDAAPQGSVQGPMQFPLQGPLQGVERHLALGVAAGVAWPDWVEPLFARVRARCPPPPLPCLTHHDFNPWNLLWPIEGDVQVLDWEYAAPGDPMFDVVTVFAHWGLDASERALLLDTYGADASARLRLPDLELLFHLREFTWAGAMAALGDTNPDVQAQHVREAAWLQAHSGQVPG